ncbi:hypothetical protein JW698_00885 [Candidatus Wolfebacteria bacterium]|nr:hypothetical protein [Candidatus Wolfebacteria bacterium]
MKFLIRLFKSLSRLERWTFIVAGLVFISSSVFIISNFIYSNTKIAPVFGGEYIEGIIGQPVFINPVLANTETDKDLITLIFSNLSDLAENIKRDEGAQVWNVRLKENIFWDDNVSITSDDIIFTIESIQNTDANSPLLSVWKDIKAERVSEIEIKLILPEVYVFFESTLNNLKIIPKHIFGSIPTTNFRLSDYNFEPIGNGPFKFVSFQKSRSGFISEYRLVRNEAYFGQKPYLEKITFKFYENEDELIKNFNSGIIDGFGGLSFKNFSRININHRLFEIIMPRYYAIFFNSYNQNILKEKNVRLALTYATDKKGLLEKIFNNKALSAEGPLVLGMDGFVAEEKSESVNFSIEKANEILENGGWKINEEGVYEKIINGKTERLEFNLVVPDIPFLIEAADLIKENWEKAGIKLNNKIFSLHKINEEAIKTRNYEMILFGNIFSDIKSPDLSSFWHSSERFYPGLNLALYGNETVDSLIQSIRKNLNDSKRQNDISSLQFLIIQDRPAIFLFSPYYFYVTKNKLNGFNEKLISSAGDRFGNIENWYIKTVRVFE